MVDDVQNISQKLIKYTSTVIEHNKVVPPHVELEWRKLNNTIIIILISTLIIPRKSNLSGHDSFGHGQSLNVWKLRMFEEHRLNLISIIIV